MHLTLIGNKQEKYTNKTLMYQIQSATKTQSHKDAQSKEINRLSLVNLRVFVTSWQI